MMTREIPWGPVLQVIGPVAEIDNPGGCALEVPNARASAIPFDIGSFNEIDLDSGRAVFVASPPEEEDADQETRAAFPRLVQQNPILQYQDRTGDGSAHRLSDFLSAEALHGLELYQRVYKPRGVEFQVAIGPDAFVLEEQSPKRGISELKRLHLTEREAELLWLLMKGKTTAEIAKDLAVAPAR